MMNEQKLKQAVDELGGRQVVVVYANGNDYGVHLNGINAETMVEAWLALSYTVFDKLQGKVKIGTPREFMLSTLSDFLDKKQDSKAIDLSVEAKDEPKVDEQGMKNPFKGFQKEFHKADPEAEAMYEKMTEEERMFADAVLGMITAAITEGRKQ